MTLGAGFSDSALALAPWSVSKVTLLASCPYAWHRKYILKQKEPAPGLATRVGVGVHRLLELVERGDHLERALPRVYAELSLTAEERAGVETFVAGVRGFSETLARVRRDAGVARELCEARLGLTADLEPTSFFAKSTFFRGVWDLGLVLGDGRLIVLDHKTGRRRPLRFCREQLDSYKILALAHFPRLEKVWPGIHFVRHAEVSWDRASSAGEIRTRLRAWFVSWINDAATRAHRGVFPTVVSGLCSTCGYRPTCPAHLGTAPLLTIGRSPSA